MYKKIAFMALMLLLSSLGAAINIEPPISDIYYGDGSDGSQTISSSGTTINSYTRLTGDESSGSNTISVQSTSGFSTGDEILIHQTQSSQTTPGRYEFRVIDSVNSGSFTLREPLQDTYSSGSFNSGDAEVAQVVSVPQYTDLTVQSGASITPKTWDGYSGGIVVFRAQNQVTVDGQINVNNDGFRNTRGQNHRDGSQGYQGEGTAGRGTTSRNQNSGAGGGGDGRSNSNGNGGGGGHRSSGQDGQNGQRDGTGGISYDTQTLSRMNFGGAGGQGGNDGDGSTSDQYGGAGASGAGIIYFTAKRIDISGSIQANGGNGGDGYDGTDTSETGGGGAGAGGSVFIRGVDMNRNNIDISGSITASGGTGGQGGNGGVGGNGANGRIRIDGLINGGTNINTPFYEGTKGLIRITHSGGSLGDIKVQDLDDSNQITSVVGSSPNDREERYFVVEQENDRYRLEFLDSGQNIEFQKDEPARSIELRNDFSGSFMNVSMINQTGEEAGFEFLIQKAGTDTNIVNEDDFWSYGLKFDRTKVFDLILRSGVYQNEIVYRNIRVPDVIEAGKNQNFIPESTMSNSLKFSAGHTIPTQTIIPRPFSDFDVVNVSIEKNLNESYRLVSDILVRKYNVNFEGQWQDWSNRKTVTVQDIYNRDWSDSTGEMNDAWGIIEFNPEGFQNNECSDVRLTDTENNVQDFTVNTCQDDYVQLEFNAPINALEAKDFYVYYGNSGASDAQTPVERLSETEEFQMDNGITDTVGGFWFRSAGQKSFNMSIPQNVEFLNREINIEGNNQDYQDNQLTSMNDDYQEYSGIEFTPKRPTVIEGLNIEMASTTVDSQIAVTNMSSGNVIHTHDIPDNGAGSYYLNFTNESLAEGNGDNIIYRSSDTFRIFVRNGQARRQATTVTSDPMYDYPDLTVDNQVYSCSSDGTSCSTGDYPTLVSGIETISLLPNLTITYDNENTVLYDEAQHLNTGTIDLSSVLQSEEWREGDPLDDPRVHEFTVDSGDEGNITLESYSSFEFEHPVESVTKNAAACSVNPQSSNYFYIDKTDCPYLDRINVTEGQWFRLDYRFRVPGPADFENTGDIKSYNVSDTMVRYNTLAETEEFTSG